MTDRSAPMDWGQLYGKYNIIIDTDPGEYPGKHIAVFNFADRALLDSHDEAVEWLKWRIYRAELIEQEFRD